MDSVPSSPAPLSSTQGPPAPPSGALLIRAPLSSPEDEADPTSASSSPSPSSFSSSSEQEELFLSGEEEPEPDFETASERPFVPDPDEEAASEDGFGEPGSPALPPAFLLRKPSAAMPKVRLSEEDEDVPEEVFDDGFAADVDGEEGLQARVVRVAVPAGGVSGLVEDAGDDDEKGTEGVGVYEELGLGGASGGDANLEASTDEYEEAAAAMEGLVVAESTKREPVLEETGDDVSENGVPHENLASDGAAVGELPDSMGSGDGSAILVEEDVVQDAGEGEHAGLGDGGEEGAKPDAEAVGDVEVAKLQSGSVNSNGTEEKAAVDGECEKGSGSRAGEGGGGSVTQVALELEPDEAESEVTAEENGARSCGGSDNDLEPVSTVTAEARELQRSETKENTEYTEEEEEKAVDSSETKESFGEDGAMKVIDISVDSGDAEYSLQKPDHLCNTDVADESVASEPKKERDETEQALGTGEERSIVTHVTLELKSEEANSEITAEESESHSGSSSADNLGTVSTDSAEAQELQPAQTKGIVWHTEEEEERAVDSSETKERAREVEIIDALKPVNISLESGDAECSLEKTNHSDRIDSADGSISSEPKKEGGETEQGSAELQMSSKEAKLNIEALDNEGYADKETVVTTLPSEDSENENSACEAMVLEVADNGGAPAISVPVSDLNKINDSSEDTDDEEQHMDLNDGGKKSVAADEHTKVAMLGNSKAAEEIIKELEEGSSGISSGLGSSRDYSNQMDGQIVSDSEGEMETDEDGDGKELFDSAALAALLKAATGASSDGSINITAPDVTRIFSVDRPAGLGSSTTSLRPAPPRAVRPNLFSPSDLSVAGVLESNVDEEERKLQEKVEQIRVKFLRLVHRLGHSPEDRVAAQVLYRLGLAEGIKHGRQVGQSFSFENAKKKALQLEENEKETLDFSCNILVIGKTGVGKSATINSIFGQEKVATDAFEPVTTSVREIIGTVDGIKVHVIDTPGLRPSVMDQTANKRTLASIKKFTKRCTPDIVLYVDRLDTQNWDFNDLPLLRSITSTLGSSIWFNAIIVLTHAASAPPDGPNGSPLSYEVFVDQRSRIVQHAIRQASGDMRFMNPVALVENHPSCRRNREGQRILPNGLSWRTQMLLLCYSSKILSDTNSLLKLQDSSSGKLFGFRVRSPPLPFFLSSLLQSRVHPKLSTDQGGGHGDSDVDLDDLSDSDQEEEEDEYDQLPPFKPLRKAQIAKLTKEQRKAYFDEYDYRVKLLQRKQWKEELKRLKEVRKGGKSGQVDPEYVDMVDDYDQDGAPATIPVPLPDMVLPPSFDCDNPAYRYRFLEPTSQLIVRPVLDTHGWDHDCGYDGVSLEENLAIASRFPAGISVQITKDKKDFNIHLESCVSAKRGGNVSTLAGFDIQSVGNQLAYILRSETKFRNLKKNKTAAGISVTFLGENIATGLKVEDQLVVGRRLSLVASTGAVRVRGDVAYGANLEMRLQEKDFPIGQDVSTLGLSLMKWRNDLALGTNFQSQFSVSRNTKMAVRVGLNNKLSGQITVRTSTSEQLQIALMGILPIAVSIYRSIWSGETY